MSGIAAESCNKCEKGKFTNGGEGKGNDKCEYCDDYIKGSGITEAVGTESVDGCVCPSQKYKEMKKKEDYNNLQEADGEAGESPKPYCTVEIHPKASIPKRLE